MQALQMIRLIAGAALLLCGLGIFFVEVYGSFHFDYVLNRMHAAAMGDTLGILFVMLGLMVLRGFSMDSLKLFLVVVFFWIASPVSGHMISRLEAMTDENLGEILVMHRKEGTREQEHEDI